VLLLLSLHRCTLQWFSMPAFRVSKDFILTALFVLCLTISANNIQAQSLDARAPSPVHTNEVVGRIGSRDLGDARLTDHFYAFTGTPGDLLITIETRNLNGDVDIFTAGSLRPVLKLVLYAEVITPVTKSIYLRHREDLILRVEARTPNDDDGTYHISFGGSFEPIAASKNDEESRSEIASAPPVTRKGKRVSSVGARIETPAPPPLEVAEAPRPEPSPSDLFDPPPAEPRAAEPPPTEAPVVEPKEETTAKASPITGRNARARASTRRGRAKAAKTDETAKKPVTEELSKEAERVEEASKREAITEISEKPVVPKKSAKKTRTVTTEEPAETGEGEPVTRESAPARTRPERQRVPPSDEEAIAQPEDLSKSKLIIELLDGSRIERYMNTVRRVDVESGQIVVTATDGTVKRIRLARVVRMSIGP
jgi:hypothetical protein